jgi:hypothetical protein
MTVRVEPANRFNLVKAVEEQPPSDDRGPTRRVHLQVQIRRNQLVETDKAVSGIGNIHYNIQPQ